VITNKLKLKHDDNGVNDNTIYIKNDRTRSSFLLYILVSRKIRIPWYDYSSNVSNNWTVII